jgi:hypothetical protein
MTAHCRPEKYPDYTDPDVDAAVAAWNLAHDDSRTIMETVHEIARLFAEARELAKKFEEPAS